MDFFEAAKRRRSIRKFTATVVPDEVIEKALDAAIIAPTSSNTQTWDFYWVKTPEVKVKMAHACLNQSAARTANHLLVVTANPKNYKRSLPLVLKYVEEVKAPAPVLTYYRKLVPTFYKWGFLNSWGLIKWVGFNIYGQFKPIMRGPFFRFQHQEVALKSAALAAENFVLAIAAQGYNTCMMEGFDQSRVRKILNLKCDDRVCMVIGIGEELPDGKGTWGCSVPYS